MASKLDFAAATRTLKSVYMYGSNHGNVEVEWVWDDLGTGVPYTIASKVELKDGHVRLEFPKQENLDKDVSLYICKTSVEMATALAGKLLTLPAR